MAVISWTLVVTHAIIVKDYEQLLVNFVYGVYGQSNRSLGNLLGIQLALAGDFEAIGSEDNIAAGWAISQGTQSVP